MREPNFLDVLAAELGLTSDAIPVLRAQLEGAFLDLSLDPSAFFLAPDPEGIWVGAEGRTLISGDLVGPDSFGYPAALELSCAAHPGEYLDPRRELPPGCALAARWTEFPGEELRRYVEAAPAFIELGVETAARVLWGWFAWPEVMLVIPQVPGEGGPSAMRLQEALLGATAPWERSKEARLEYRGSWRVTSQGHLEILIDFGDAPRAALARVLSVLAAELRGTQHILVGLRATR